MGGRDSHGEAGVYDLEIGCQTERNGGERVVGLRKFERDGFGGCALSENF